MIILEALAAFVIGAIAGHCLGYSAIVIWKAIRKAIQ